MLNVWSNIAKLMVMRMVMRIVMRTYFMQINIPTILNLFSYIECFLFYFVDSKIFIIIMYLHIYFDRVEVNRKKNLV